ncbi:hypothetical protein Tco_0682517 [Tanacetum coccineum]|uniref:DNA-directed primase/polymerase protein n=1 Tax=Tanacetum coccineum TaxID=301880 RepID=A0ABQ4XRD8_9ASTR
MTTSGGGGTVADGGDGSGGSGSGDGDTDDSSDGEGGLALLRMRMVKVMVVVRMMMVGVGEDDDGKSDGGDVGISFPGLRAKAGLVDKGQVGVGMRSDDGDAGLTGKLLISSSESDMMTNGMSTQARGVVAGKGVGREFWWRYKSMNSKFLHHYEIIQKTCSRIHSARNRDKKFEKLFISKDSSCGGVPCHLFIDTAVYSKTCCFHLHLSSKAGKDSVLLTTGRFKSKEINEEDVFMKSLICNVGEDCEKLLMYKINLDCIKVLHYDTEEKYKIGIGSQNMVLWYTTCSERNFVKELAEKKKQS